MDEQTILDRLIKGSINEALDKVLAILEADDGKSFEEQKKEIAQLLSAKMEKPEDSCDKDSVSDVTDTFWQQGEITVAEGLILRRVKETDREHYLALEQHYFVAKSMLEDETFRDKVWRNHIDDTSALFEMKKGAAFLVRQDQQNDAQIFMILF